MADLLSEYQEISDDLEKIYVVPLIEFDHADTSYLYQLYRNFLESNDPSAGYPAVESLSVYAHFKFVRDQLSGNSILVHYHWIEFQDFKSAVGMIWKLLCLYLYKKSGGTLVWTVHNTLPHEDRWPGLNHQLMKLMGRWADRLHIHCKSVLDSISQHLDQPKRKFFIRPHPRFPATKIPRDQALHKLNTIYDFELTTRHRIFLSFGHISQYKQLGKLIHYFKTASTDNILLIAGSVKKGNREYFQQLVRLTGDTRHIQLVPRFIPGEHVSLFFNAADFAIYNHRRILTSGAVQLALSYDKPIIAPNMGCLREKAGCEGFYLFDNQDQLKNLIEQLTTG